MRVITVLFLFLGLGCVAVGLYHAILSPFDYGNQHALRLLRPSRQRPAVAERAARSAARRCPVSNRILPF